MSTSYRWVIVGAGALMTCVALGAMFSLAIFQEPIATATGWSHAGIASAMTLNFIVMGIGGFFWGTASDRFGPRPVVLIGSVILGTALILASRAETLLAFQLTYGVLVGFSASAFFAPMIAATSMGPDWTSTSVPKRRIASTKITTQMTPRMIPLASAASTSTRMRP